jgi:hypothetical protein
VPILVLIGERYLYLISSGAIDILLSSGEYVVFRLIVYNTIAVYQSRTAIKNTPTV